VEKTGVEIGVSRARSFRAPRGFPAAYAEILIVGSRDSVTVTRELNIRRTLSSSACTAPAL
jgi:hypothetical protein